MLIRYQMWSIFIWILRWLNLITTRTPVINTYLSFTSVSLKDKGKWTRNISHRFIIKILYFINSYFFGGLTGPESVEHTERHVTPPIGQSQAGWPGLFPPSSCPPLQAVLHLFSVVLLLKFLSQAAWQSVLSTQFEESSLPPKPIAIPLFESLFFTFESFVTSM